MEMFQPNFNKNLYNKEEVGSNNKRKWIPWIPAPILMLQGNTF